MNLYSVVDWNMQQTPVDGRLLMKFHHQTEITSDPALETFSNAFVLSAEQVESLIEELQHQLKGLQQT